MEKAGESDVGELQWDVAEARRIVGEIEGIGAAIGTSLPDVGGSDDDAPPQSWRRVQSDNVGDESMDGHETEGHPTPAPTWLSHYVPSIGRQRTPSTVSGSLNQTMSPQIPSSSMKATNPFYTTTPKLSERLARRESNTSNVHGSGTADQQLDRVIVVEAPAGQDTIAIIEAVTRPLKEALERADQRADRYETELEKLRAENWELKARLQRYEVAS